MFRFQSDNWNKKVEIFVSSKNLNVKKTISVKRGVEMSDHVIYFPQVHLVRNSPPPKKKKNENGFFTSILIIE